LRSKKINDYENRELNKRPESRRIKEDLRFSEILQERCAIFGRTAECVGANYAVEDRADRRSLSLESGIFLAGKPDTREASAETRGLPRKGARFSRRWVTR